jgi:hypothetical protein
MDPFGQEVPVTITGYYVKEGRPKKGVTFSLHPLIVTREGDSSLQERKE